MLLLLLLFLRVVTRTRLLCYYDLQHDVYWIWVLRCWQDYDLHIRPALLLPLQNPTSAQVRSRIKFYLPCATLDEAAVIFVSHILLPRLSWSGRAFCSGMGS